MKCANIFVNTLGRLLLIVIFLTIPEHTTINVTKKISVTIETTVVEKSTESSLRMLAILGETRYIVQKYDGFNSIAEKFYILPWQLMQANWIKNRMHTLHPGETLIIPNVRWEVEHGYASWYGDDLNVDDDYNFNGKPMANGDIYDMYNIHTIAHRTLPLNSWVRLTDERTGKSLIVKVTDRGPFTKDPDGNFLRQVDLSFAGAIYFGSVEDGVIYLKIEPLGMRL